MADMTVKQALAAVETEVRYHAGSDTHYRAERLCQALATLRELRAERDALAAALASTPPSAPVGVETIGFRYRMKGHAEGGEVGDWHYNYHRSPDSFELRECEIQTVYAGTLTQQPEAQAGVAHATASKDAEIERLRGALKKCNALSVDRWRRLLAAGAENERLRAEVERLDRLLGRIVEGDGDSTLTIRAGTDAFAAAKEYLSAPKEQQP